MAKRTTSPKGGKRGCLGADGTYSPENCKGELHQQGVGSTVEQSISDVVNTSTTRTIVTERG